MNQDDQATTTRHKEVSIGVNMGNSETVYWTKPPIGVIKINWDAALDLQTGLAGLGTIARDHEGRVLAMATSTYQHIRYHTTVETLAAWHAVVLGIHLGATYLLMEGMPWKWSKDSTKPINVGAGMGLF